MSLFGLVLPVLVGVLVFTGGSGSAATSQHPVLVPMSGSYLVKLTFDGMARDYRLHVPPSAIGGKPLPLVLNLHGATQNAAKSRQVRRRSSSRAVSKR